MKKYLQILLLVFIQVSFSQTKLDTTSLKMEVIGFHINPQTNDTTKWSNKRIFTSGLIKETLYSNNKPFGISIFLNDPQPHEIDNKQKFFYLKFIPEDDTLEIRSFFDSKGNLDSTHFKYSNESYTSHTVKTIKHYNLFGKLKKLTSWDGTYLYDYNLRGQIKKIEFSSDEFSNRKKNYKNGLLQTKESQNPNIAIESIQYNQQNNPIRVDRKLEYVIYKYDRLDNLLEKATYRKIESYDTGVLAEKIVYKYDEGRLISEEIFHRNKHFNSVLYVYKNAR